MATQSLKIATRESPLALWQANHIRSSLKSFWPNLDIELLPLKTTGDKFLKDKLLTLGGKGLFVKELEESLLDNRADLAVHSMKDVPVEFPKGLMLATICKRDDPFDALLSNRFSSLEDLPKNAVVGTVSLRRQTQLLALRPDLTIKPLRGNIQSRIKKMESGEFDAIILAVSGLERMNLEHLIKERFNIEKILPACGQGAMGIECRQGDRALQKLLEPLHHQLSSTCVAAERKINELLGGNCHAPLAVYCAPINESEITLHAKVLSIDGKKILKSNRTGLRTQAAELATDCAQALIEQGAATLIRQALSHE